LFEVGVGRVRNSGGGIAVERHELERAAAFGPHAAAGGHADLLREAGERDATGVVNGRRPEILENHRRSAAAVGDIAGEGYGPQRLSERTCRQDGDDGCRRYVLRQVLHDACALIINDADVLWTIGPDHES
jgi:hypothetical protein